MKAILVLDEMSLSCNVCPLRAKDGNIGEYCTAHGVDRIQNYMDGATKPDWCSLRPLPERKEEMEYLAVGYNKCLDDILEG